MKYYEFQGLVGAMPEKQFKSLLEIEPGVTELTQKEYENYHGIGQAGQPGKNAQGKPEPMGEDAKEQTGSQVQGTPNTKKEIIEKILARGNEFTRSELARKRKDELIELL